MKQHIVSKCYLKAWCDPNTPKGHDPFIWLISRDGTSKVKRSPEKSLRKSDIYTLKLNDGTTDLRIETTLSQLETKFVHLQRKLRERKSIDRHDRAYLIAFIATMYSRTDPFAIGMEEAWTGVDEMVRHAEELIRTKAPEDLPKPIFPGQGCRVNSTETSLMVRNARPTAVDAALSVLAPLLFRMNLAFFIAPKPAFYLTSDNPCAWFDPTAYRRPPSARGAALTIPTVEVTMPIAPDVLAVITHNRRLNGYFDQSAEQVSQANRRVIAFTHEHFVSNTQETRPIWFSRGTPPPDAWENHNTAEEKPRNPFDP